MGSLTHIQRTGMRGVFAGAALTGLLAAVAPVAAESLFSNWGIAPQYESSYLVQRKETKWQQRLSVDHRGGLVDFGTSLKTSARKDEARNDFQEYDNLLDLTLERATALGKLSFSGASHKDWREDQYSLTVRNEDRMSVTELLPLLDRSGAKLSFSAGGGWVQEKDVRENRRGTNSSLSRTWATGWEGDAGLEARWDPGATFNLASGLTWNGSLQDSDSRIRENESDTLITATDHSRSFGFHSEAEWSRYEACQLALTVRLADESSQFYQANVQSQETKLASKRSFDLVAGGSLARPIAYEAELTSDYDNNDYQIQTSDRYSSSRGLRLGLQYDVGLPLLRGATWTANAKTTSRRTARQNTDPFDTREKTIETELARPLGEGITIAGKLEENLTQDFYDTGKLDKDRLRAASSLYLTYEPSDRSRSRGGYVTTVTEVVNISAQRSAQNQSDEDYRITADYQALLPYDIRVQQYFQISASYTYFAFDEDKNKLTRTNRVTSKLGIPLFEHARMNLEHIFNRSDTGAYVYQTGGTDRAYSSGSESLRQYLKADLTYGIAGMITLKGTGSLDVNSNHDVVRDRTTRREKQTFTGEVDFQRELAGGLQVTARFARTRSSQEDDYWDIDASLVKTFD
jgi:hypothetical protein